MLTLQILRVMDAIWQEEGLDLRFVQHSTRRRLDFTVIISLHGLTFLFRTAPIIHISTHPILESFHEKSNLSNIHYDVLALVSTTMCWLICASWFYI